MTNGFQQSFIFLTFLLIIFSCQLKVDRPEIQKTLSTHAEDSKPSFDENGSELNKRIHFPKIGLILGAGGAKTWAHIGFLREINNRKIPIHSIVGIEMAAPIAAIFAHREMANEVEWKMFKLDEDKILKRTFLSSKYQPQDVSIINEFLNDIFNGIQTSQIKLPFGCPALNLQKKTHFMMSRGSVQRLVELCLPYPPLFQSYKGNVSGIRDLKASADFLKSMGATYIVFVNVLSDFSNGIENSGLSERDRLAWTEVSSAYKDPNQIIDQMIVLPTEEFTLLDFSKRRDILKKGLQYGIKSIDEMAKKLKL